MDYTYAEQKNNDLILYGVKHFDLAQTLDCGQAFRWRDTSGGYSGIVNGRRLDISLSDDKVMLKDVSVDEFELIWKDYFDFSRNYDELKKNFLIPQGELQNAVKFSPGLRLLRQDIWETLISYILSQNTNIPRIKKMIESLCKCYGKKLPCGGYDFPTAEILAAQTELTPIKCGYRAAYVLDAARRAASGKFDPLTLSKLSTDEIKKALLEIHGVGPKVADCVILYGFGRTEIFPKDVWIKRVMSEYYPNGFPVEITEHVGIAQLFLFHYIRNKN